MGQRCHDHLRVAPPAFREQRTNGTVDQAGNKRFLFGRTAFPLEIAARDATGGIGFLLVVAGQGKEIDSGLRLLGGHNGGNDDRLAIGGQYSPVGLTRYLTGFKDELAPTPVKFLTINIEHSRFLSWFSDGRKSHEQDGERLPHAGDLRLATASSDPAMAFGPSVWSAGTVPRTGSAVSAAGLNGGRNPIRSNMRGSTRARFDQRRIPSLSINVL